MNSSSKPARDPFGGKQLYEGLPTAYELASLAVRVMQAVPEGELDDYLEMAWEFHYAAHCKIGELVDRRSRFKDFKKETAPDFKKLPPPKQYPVLLRKALILVMPHQAEAERLAIYREYLQVTHPQVPASEWEEWVTKRMEYEGNYGFDEVMWKAFALTFSHFMRLRQDQVMHQRAQKAGKARAEKK